MHTAELAVVWGVCCATEAMHRWTVSCQSHGHSALQERVPSIQHAHRQGCLHTRVIVTIDC
jgi:hypothetical protein